MRVLSFGLVGATAAAVHYCVAILIVAALGAHPLIGNVGGYVVALFVSYIGQKHFTFRGAESTSLNFLRFAATSLSAFALNFFAYWALLHFTNIDYRIALVIVLVAVAAFTYFVLNRWVFPTRTATSRS